VSKPARKKWDVLALGLATYDHLTRVPTFEDMVRGCGAQEISVQGGGVAATAAAAVARLGGKVRFHTRVGEDYFGKFIINGLKDIGVDVKAGVVTDGLSPVCDVMVDKTGERRFIYFSGKNLDVPGYAVPEAEVAASGAVLIDGRWPEASVDLAQKALKHGVPIVLDIGHSRPHELELLRIADYPVLSTVILGNRGGDPAERQKLAEKVLAVGRAKFVVVTRGGDGIELYERDGGKVKVTPYPAYKINVIDTCGAGDAFHGAFALGVSRNWPVGKVLDVAQATGALTCRKLGGRVPLPTMQEVEELIARGR